MPAKHLVIPEKKFSIIAWDPDGEGALSLQPEGRVILSIADRLTGFVQFIGLRKKSRSSVSDKLVNRWINIFGRPDAILLDNVFDTKGAREWSTRMSIHLQYCGRTTIGKLA